MSANEIINISPCELIDQNEAFREELFIQLQERYNLCEEDAFRKIETIKKMMDIIVKEQDPKNRQHHSCFKEQNNLVDPSWLVTESDINSFTSDNVKHQQNFQKDQLSYSINNTNINVKDFEETIYENRKYYKIINPYNNQCHDVNNPASKILEREFEATNGGKGVAGGLNGIDGIKMEKLKFQLKDRDIKDQHKNQAVGNDNEDLKNGVFDKIKKIDKPQSKNQKNIKRKNKKKKKKLEMMNNSDNRPEEKEIEIVFKIMDENQNIKTAKFKLDMESLKDIIDLYKTIDEQDIDPTLNTTTNFSKNQKIVNEKPKFQGNYPEVDNKNRRHIQNSNDDNPENSKNPNSNLTNTNNSHEFFYENSKEVKSMSFKFCTSSTTNNHSTNEPTNLSNSNNSKFENPGLCSHIKSDQHETEIYVDYNPDDYSELNLKNQ